MVQITSRSWWSQRWVFPWEKICQHCWLLRYNHFSQCLQFWFISSSISPLLLPGIAICLLITAFDSTQTLQKICLTNHIHSLAKLLHADMIQQLEVALLGSPAAKILGILTMATQSQTSSTALSSRLLHLATIPLVTTPAACLVLPPQVAIVGVNNIEEPPMAQASTSKKIPSPLISADHEAGPSKCRRIIWTPILITSSNPSNSASKLPSIIVPKLAVPACTLPEQINHPWGHKDYKCQLCAFQHMNKDCMLMHIWQHLEILVSCPCVARGFRMWPPFRKHGRKYIPFK